MSQASSRLVRRVLVRSALLRVIQGLALWGVFGGLGACGSQTTEADGAAGSQVSQASTESADTQIDGQSGTEYEPGGDSRPDCPCGIRNPLRGTVLEVVPHIERSDFFPAQLGNVRIRVDELLGSTTGLEIGSEISGGWFGDLPCFFGCASVEAGDEVLAFYQPERPCPTPGECIFGDTIAASIALAPWDDSGVVLARFVNGDLTLAIEDIPLLESPECRERIGSIGDFLGPRDEGVRCYEILPPPP